MTQEQKIIERLQKTGSVNNFWAVKNYILRLGARIADLRKKGWLFSTGYGKGNEKKNFYYHVVK